MKYNYFKICIEHEALMMTDDQSCKMKIDMVQKSRYNEDDDHNNNITESNGCNNDKQFCICNCRSNIGYAFIITY